MPRLYADLMIVTIRILVMSVSRLLGFSCPEFFARHVFLAVHNDINFGRRNAIAIDPRHLQRGTNVEPLHRLLQQLERNARVHQRAKKHIAADAGKAFEVSNAHGSRPLARRTSAPRNAWWEPSS